MVSNRRRARVKRRADCRVDGARPRRPAVAPQTLHALGWTARI